MMTTNQPGSPQDNLLGTADQLAPADRACGRPNLDASGAPEVPAGMAHAVAATGDGPGRALVVASPSEFARLVTEAGTPNEGGPPSADTDKRVFLRACGEPGDEILGPPGALPG